MSNNNAPPAPDYTPIANAQLANAQMANELAREQMAWARQTYTENKGVTDRVVESFLSTQQTNAENAAKDRARYENTFQPLEDSLAKDAQDYASPERKDLEIGRAEANVAQQFEGARQASTRELESYGIDPSSTRFAALDLGVRTQEAASQAAAGNQAGQMVDATGRALRSEAINVGRGYPGQIAGTTNTSLQAGTGANNGTLATTASGANTMGTGTSWSSVAGNALTGATGALHTGYGDQMAQYNADQKNGWGQIVGTAIGAGAMFLADGGAVGDAGEFVPAAASPSKGGAIDDVNARVSVGEFIVPKSTVEFKGTEFFYKLIDKSREAEEEMKQSSGAIPVMRAVRKPASSSALTVH